MIAIKFLKPVQERITADNKLCLSFTYQYLSILKGDEIYYFVPIEDKEIIVDMYSLQIENKYDVLVFQRGERFIRLPLHQLMLVSDLHKFLRPIVEKYINNHEEINLLNESDLELLFKELEKQNLLYAIDETLDSRNEAMFYELVSKL